jgi:uncharacterized alpha-E superfamily protein
MIPSQGDVFSRLIVNKKRRNREAAHAVRGKMCSQSWETFLALAINYRPPMLAAAALAVS